MGMTFTNDSATISTSEYSLPADTTTSVPTSQTTSGVFTVAIDFGNLTSTESYRVRIYEKYDAAGTQRLVDEFILTGAQSKPLFVLPSLILGAGWDITVLKLAGTDRTIYWSIRRVV